MKMTRGFAFLVAAVTLLAGIDHARAQGFDMRDVMGGGSFFGLGRSSSARREVVSFVSQYKPGTIFIDTAERRLYLVLPQGRRFATASVSAATAFAGPASTRSPRKSTGPAGPRLPRCC